MAKIKISNKQRIVVEFTSPPLLGYLPMAAYATKQGKKFYVNFAFQTMLWYRHDIQAVDDVLSAIRLIGNWQGKLQDMQPRWGTHAPKPTVFEDQGLFYQKIRYPVFRKRSAPYVQWTRTHELNEWMVMGMSFHNDLPSMGALYAALSRLKTSYQSMNRNVV